MCSMLYAEGLSCPIMVLLNNWFNRKWVFSVCTNIKYCGKLNAVELYRRKLDIEINELYTEVFAKSINLNRKKNWFVPLLFHWKDLFKELSILCAMQIPYMVSMSAREYSVSHIRGIIRKVKTLECESALSFSLTFWTFRPVPFNRVENRDRRTLNRT